MADTTTAVPTSTPGWGTDPDHYDNTGKLKPDPAILAAKKAEPAPKERAALTLKPLYDQNYLMNTQDNPPLTFKEWRDRRMTQTIGEREAENKQLGIEELKPQQYQYGQKP